MSDSKMMFILSQVWLAASMGAKSSIAEIGAIILGVALFVISIFLQSRGK